MASTGAYVHLTNDTTAQTNVPGATGGAQLVRVVINQKAAAASFLTLKDGTNVIAVIDLLGGAGFNFEYGVICTGALSRTFSTVSGATCDLTIVFA